MIAARRAIQQGIPLTPERETVGDFLTRWLADSVGPSVRPSTFEAYSIYSRKHLIPGLGRVRLAKLAPQDAQAFMNRKLGEGLSPRTVLHLRAILRWALGQAMRWGLVGRNVAALIDPPRVPHEEIRPLTPEEARAFLSAIQGDRLEALYTVAIACGLRRGD